MSKNRFRGVLFGAGVTAVIQSSTAATVMAVGFVNAGIINLNQVVGIIMGANIGSTTTSWLVSSVEWAAFLRPDALGAVCAALGAMLLLFSKKSRIKNIGEVIVGFGVLFIGLSQMPLAVKPLAQLDAVRDLFVTLGDNPLLALLAGILVTGIIQSSSASIGILQSMAISGMIPWSAAVFIVLGQNVGTCFTTMITGIGTNKNTRAASYVHFVYNAAGAVVFSIAFYLFFAFVNPALGAAAASSTQISMIHTGYNVLLLLLLFPLGGTILRVAVKMAGKDEKAHTLHLTELDESILEAPAYALENSIKAVRSLTGLLRTSLVTALDLFIERAFDKIPQFYTLDASADTTNATIHAFLTKLYNGKLTQEQNVTVATLLHMLIYLERINMHIKGIVRQAEALRDMEMSYTEQDLAVLADLRDKTLSCYDATIHALTSSEPTHAARAVQLAEQIHTLRENVKTEYFARVSSGRVGVQSGIVYMETVRHMSRIASNAKSIVEWSGEHK
jgi:phosphate:Na+ symporter